MKSTWTYLWDHPLQRRISLLTTVAVALAVILFSVAGYLTLSVSLHRASESIALTVARDLAGTARDDLLSTGRLSPGLRQAGGVVVEAVDAEGRVLRLDGQADELVLGPRDWSVAGPDGRASQWSGTSRSGHPYAIGAVPLAGTSYALVVGRTLAPVEEILRVQRLILLAVSLAGIVAAAVAGILVGRAGLRPMRQLTEAVEHVTATQDLQPVSVRYARGDLATLAASFNLMLASLTRTRNRQARLVADAGHELRTPLTSLRTNVDLLASDVRRDALTVEAREAVLADLQGQLGEMSDMIGDLVHVTREDGAASLAPLDVREVVGSSLERVQRRAQGVTFDVALDPLFVVANAEALGRAVTNLLDNAVKWSPPGGTVRVRVEGNRLRVSDAGPGIPEADLPYVFDRFFRGESARKTKGTGLGLAIVAKAVEELGGTVSAGRSAEGGAEFTLQLPGVTSREAVSSLLVPAST